MKKEYKRGFFLSETIVVIAVVAVVLLGVFKLFSSVYYGFSESENYNTTFAINAIANIDKYYESIAKIDTSLLSDEKPYINLTDSEKYRSELYAKIKEEYNITDIYLINTQSLFKGNKINDFYVLLRRYLNTLKEVEGVVLVVAINNEEFAHTKVINLDDLSLVGDKDDEYVVYVPLNGEFIDPGYTGWSGDTPYIEWEDEKVIDVTTPGTYYLKYDFNGYIFRRKVIVGPIETDVYMENLKDINLDEHSVEVDTTTDGNIRYTGSSPRNYVTFNNETWRIIGLFDVTTDSESTEKLMKIVRNDSLGNMSWDSSASTVNNGYGINEWSQADLQSMLNGYYVGNGSSCTYCNGSSQASCSKDCSSTVTPLSNNAVNMIQKVRWNTGAITYASTITADSAYSQERSTTTGKICTSGTYCNDTVERTTTWTGLVGLIYPSDYVYASTDTSCRANIYDTSNVPCKNNNWLHNSSIYWTLSPSAYSSRAHNVWSVVSGGFVSGSGANLAHGVRPAIYLKSNVSIVSGAGTSSNPYQIAILNRDM